MFPPLQEGPAKANAKNPDDSTVIVIDIIQIHILGRQFDLGVRFDGTFG
jgi:hypothetical protein